MGVDWYRESSGLAAVRTAAVDCTGGMERLRELIATSSLSNVATLYWDKTANYPTEHQPLVAIEESAILFWFYTESLTVIMTAAAGILFVLFLTSLARPFTTIHVRKLSEQDGREIPSESGDEASASSRSPQWLQLWNDFTSPLTYFMTNNFDDSNETDVDTSLTPRPCHVLHFCFLMHGHRGYSQDLDYLSAQMRRVAKAVFDKRNSEGNASSATDSLLHDIVVHATVCNEKKTTDGVINGGERAIQEMLDVITTNVAQRQDLDGNATCQDITISVLGNSLGGIYARYAIAKLLDRWNCSYVGSDPSALVASIQNRSYRIHYNIFCTTATPHLGVAGHTFLPIPRTAEIGVAHALGNTGRDLFRLNDLLKDMATSREYLEPLGRFRKRIAYANAYGTDFPVPAHTAAFLSETSSYPHHFYDDDENEVIVQDNGLIVATLHTPASSEYSYGASSTDLQLEASEDESEDKSELELMSHSLDSLGWKKVFIDVRKEIPKIALPTSFIRKTVTQMTSNERSGSMVVMSEDQEAPELLHQLRERGVVGSKDIAAAVTVPLFDEQFHWPMGHNMIVAFSRSKLSAYLNKAGRPVVDALAKSLVEDIFSWQPAGLSKSEAK